MCMTGEHEVDEFAAWVAHDSVSVVRCVSHEDDRSVWFFRDGEVRVGRTGSGVFDTTEPDAAVVAFDRDEAVAEHRDPELIQSACHYRGVEGNVVVPEDREDLRSLESTEYLGAAMRCVFGRKETECAVGDEVSSEEDEIWPQLVDAGYNSIEKEGLSVLVEMNVANLCDAEAVETVRQICDVDRTVNDLEFVACDFAGIKDHPGSSNAGGQDELTAGEARPLAASGTRHTFHDNWVSPMSGKSVRSQVE